MAWKTFDFSCVDKKCVNYMVKVERMVKDTEQDTQVCEYCGNILNIGFGVGGIRTGDNGNRLKI